MRVSKPYSCAWSTTSPASSVAPIPGTSIRPPNAQASRGPSRPRTVIRILRVDVMGPRIRPAWVRAHHAAAVSPRAIRVGGGVELQSAVGGVSHREVNRGDG